MLEAYQNSPKALHYTRYYPELAQNNYVRQTRAKLNPRTQPQLIQKLQKTAVTGQYYIRVPKTEPEIIPM